MAIDFPSSPSSGQQHSHNDSLWEWDGSSWNRVGGLINTNATQLVGIAATQFARRDIDNIITGVTTFIGNGYTGVGNTVLIVEGDARVTGVLSIGQGSVSINERDISAVGVITGSNFKTGTTNVHNVGVEAAGINVLGADTPIGTGATVYNSGLVVSKSGAEYQGVVTALGGFNVTGNVDTDTLNVSGVSTFTGAVTINTDSTINATLNSRRLSVASAHDIVFNNGTWSGNIAAKLQHHNNIFYSQGGSGGWAFLASGGAGRLVIDGSGHVKPGSDSTYDLGVTDKRWRNFFADSATFTDNVTIGGVLTYEDVKNVDSVGVITARSGIRLGATGANTLITGDANKVTLTSNAHDGGFEILAGNNNQESRFKIQGKAANGTEHNWVIGASRSADRFYVSDTTATRFAILDGGQTLINQTSALDSAVMLGVKNPTSNDTVVDVVCGNTTAGSHIAFSDDAYARGIISYNHANNFLAFRTNGVTTDRLHITSAGHVLIGGTSWGAAGSMSIASYGGFQSILASGQSQDTMLGAISGASNGFQINTDGSNNQTYTFHNGSAASLRITSAGKVGINSTSPADLLTIGAAANTLAFGAKDTTRGNHIWQLLNNDNSGNAEFRMYKNSVSGTHAQSINFATSGDHNYILDGNFGLGTSTIRERFHIHRTNSDEAYLRFTNTGTGTGAADGFNIGINSAEQALIWNKEDTDMLFGTHGATRMTIDSDGTTKLQRSSYSTSAATVSNAALYLDIGSTEGAVNMNQLIGFGYRNNTTGAKPAYIGYQATTWSSHTRGDLIFGTRSTTTSTDEATERLRITHDGQVSIGNNPTVVADAALHIELDGTREYLRLEGDGGTSNAYIELEAPNNRRKAIIFKSGGTRRGVIGVGDSDEAADATSLFFSASSNIGGDSPHMVIDSSGKVGIGEDTPTSLLHLKGSAPRITLMDTGGSNDYAKIFSTGGALYLQQRDDSSHGNIIFRTEDNSGAQEKLRITGDKVMFTADAKVDANNTRDLGASGARWKRGYFGTGLIVQGVDSGTVDGIIITNTSTTNNGFSIGVASDEAAFLWNGSDTPMTFATKNTERFRIGQGTAGNALIMFGGVANNSNKIASITCNHYSYNTTNQIGMIRCKTVSGSNKIEIGGNSDSAGETAATSIQFYTAANATTNNGTERLRIDSSGHMGLGVTPNTNWPSNNDFKALQIGTGLAVFGRGSGDEDRGGIAVNYYTDGSNNYYIGNGNANRIYMNDGNIDFQYAGSNSNGAGQALTFARALRIASDGQFQISAPNTGTHFSVGTGSHLATMTVTDTTEPSAIGVGGKIIFASKYYNSSNTMAGAYIGQYKMAAPSNGVDEYRHSLTFGTRNETDGMQERMRITHKGQISIDSRSKAGTVFGNARLSILPESRTSAFDAATGATWHDVVLMQSGSATNNAVGIAFQLKNDGSYHHNAGTGIAAVKNGTNSDYGADLVFITRPQSAVAAERLRIKSDGEVVIKNNHLTLEVANTATTGRYIGITNASGSTGWTFGNGVTASAHQFVIYDNTDGEERYKVDNEGTHTFKSTGNKELLRLNYTGEGDRYDFKVKSFQVPSLTNGNWTKVMGTCGTSPSVGDAGYYVLVFQGFEQSQTGGTLWSVSAISPPVYIHSSNGNDGESTEIPLRANGHANSGGTAGEPLSCRLVWRGSSSHTPGEIQLRPNGFSYSGTAAYCYAYKLIQR